GGTVGWRRSGSSRAVAQRSASCRGPAGSGDGSAASRGGASVVGVGGESGGGGGGGGPQGDPGRARPRGGAQAGIVCGRRGGGSVVRVAETGAARDHSATTAAHGPVVLPSEDLIAEAGVWFRSQPRSPLDSLFGGGPPLPLTPRDPTSSARTTERRAADADS